MAISWSSTRLLAILPPRAKFDKRVRAVPVLPRVTPMPLARLDRPFDDPDWVFEPKLDGFRAVAYIEAGTCRLVSRNWNAFKTFDPLAAAIAQNLSDHTAILDGEIPHPGKDGRPLFYELMRRRGPFCFYAFDRL